MTIQTIEQELNEVIAENFFSYFKQMLTNKTVQKFKRSAEYNSSTELEKQEKTNALYKKINKDLSTFYLTRKALYAIEPLVEREKKIIEFTSENVHKVYINYIDTEYDFTVSHNSKFTEDMTRERDDLILELRNPKYEHRVANFIEEESEKSPPPPLTNASIKYSAFYLISFKPEYTTQLLNKLFRVGLITNPDTNGWRIEDETIDELITTLHQVFPSEMVLESKRKYNDIIVDREIKECIRPLYFTTDFYPKNILKQEKFRNIRFEKDIPSEEEDAKKLYDFIFNYTLSTQLNNSKYNTSELVIQVGHHKLRAKSNFLIKGNENWEALIGEKIRTIKEASKDNEDRETVIPFIKIDTKLLPSNIYSHHFNSRTPPRYGVGRFICIFHFILPLVSLPAFHFFESQTSI